MQPYQEYQQQSQDQGQPTPSQPSLEPTSKASQPPEGTYQPTIQEPLPYQQVYPGQGGQPPYQQPYPPPQAYQQAYPGYPGYAGAYPMFGRKDWLLTLLLCLFLGWFGAHRFYTGHILIGIIQLLTFGGCGVWTIVDLILILTDNYRDANGYPLVKP